MLANLAERNLPVMYDAATDMSINVIKWKHLPKIRRHN